MATREHLANSLMARKFNLIKILNRISLFLVLLFCFQLYHCMSNSRLKELEYKNISSEAIADVEIIATKKVESNYYYTIDLYLITYLPFFKSVNYPNLRSDDGHLKSRFKKSIIEQPNEAEIEMLVWRAFMDQPDTDVLIEPQMSKKCELSPHIFWLYPIIFSANFNCVINLTAIAGKKKFPEGNVQ